MFTQDRSATASYRALARGSGGRWARTYRVLQEDHAARHNPQRRDLSGAGDATGDQAEDRGARRRS